MSVFSEACSRLARNKDFHEVLETLTTQAKQDLLGVDPFDADSLRQSALRLQMLNIVFASIIEHHKPTGE